jgi:hypothetical protein
MANMFHNDTAEPKHMAKQTAKKKKKKKKKKIILYISNWIMTINSILQ